MQTVKAGENIFCKGEQGEHAYIIERGQVDISFKRGERSIRVASLGPGEIFGEMALIDNRERSATATAAIDCELLVIRREQIQAVLKTADSTVSLLLEVLLGRFRSMQGRLDFSSEPSAVIAQSTESLRKAERYRHRNAIDRLKLERELEQAIEENEFQLLMQPIISMTTGRPAGFEALLRWDHSERGYIPPDQFIAIAESTDLIQSIDLWVIRHAFRQIREIHNAIEAPLGPLPFVSINLSGVSFTSDKALTLIQDLVEESDIDPSIFKIEITEGVLIDNPKQVSIMLDRLREMGVQIALDDFGTGYSSLSYLVAFPISTIKIDRIFVSNMLVDGRSLEVVRAIISMAHTLDLKVIAEGIENVPELQSLWQMNCDYGQGFLLGRPLDMEKAVAYAKRGPVMTTGPVMLQN